jgi:hypothetical protein
MASYSLAGKSLTHAVGHDAEQDHKQIPTRSVQSDQAASCRFVTRGLGSLQHHYHVGGSQCDKDKSGRNI